MELPAGITIPSGKENPHHGIQNREGSLCEQIVETKSQASPAAAERGHGRRVSVELDPELTTKIQVGPVAQDERVEQLLGARVSYQPVLPRRLHTMHGKAESESHQP